MFNVGRYDPRKEALAKASRPGTSSSKATQNNTSKSKSRRKRRRKDEGQKDESRHEGTPKTSATKPSQEKNYVIAPEAKGPRSGPRKQGKIEEEAFDDMELEDDLVFGINKEEAVFEKVPKKQKTDGDDVSDPSAKEVTSAIRMSNFPILEAAKKWNLAPFLVKNLEKQGFENFFPIQALVIPDVIASERYSNIRAQDICVAAPTGSGKTLAFVLPVLNSLAGRRIKRLRALVVLPSRDLAQQVYEVFQQFAEGSDLSIGLAIGQSDFHAEQIALTVDETSQAPPMLGGTSLEAAKQRCLFDPGNAEYLINTFSSVESSTSSSLQIPESTIPRGGRSAVDVLVCTPGRLVSHLDETPGFTLQHLKFLVVDEADRLLSQTYHNWIGRVIETANSASVAAWNEINNLPVDEGGNNQLKVLPFRDSPDGCPSYEIDMITWRRGGAAGDTSSFNTNESSVVASVCRPIQLRKLLYSATLTRDPRKLAALRLVNPKHFDAHSLRESDAGGGTNKYTMPDKLLEYTVECTAEQKPLVLLAILLERLEAASTVKQKPTKKSIIAVFTSSIESTHRLARLLQLLWKSAGYGDQDAIAEFSSTLTQKERSHLVKRCGDADDNISVVVCSDGISRGMDIKSVGTVINYDVPGFAKTYTHRCGRTARAGKEGVAITLLKGGQTGQFAKVRQLIDFPERIQSMGVKKSLVKGILSVYKSCLKKLAEVVAAENDGELRPTDAIPTELFK